MLAESRVLPFMTSIGARALAHDATLGVGATRSRGVSTPVRPGDSARARALSADRTPQAARRRRTLTANRQNRAASWKLAPPCSGPTPAVTAPSALDGPKRYKAAHVALSAPNPAAPLIVA